MSQNNSLSLIQDNRVDCWSAMGTMTIGSYLELAVRAYEKRGGIQHQREAIKTTSARRIRARLVEDLRRGAVVPPLVIGIVVNDEDWQLVSQIKDLDQLQELLERYRSGLAIIDGMQRTTALLEAKEQDESIIDRLVRIETWVAKSADSLIYRMLVLNTGQVPWNLRQQLQVVYAPLVESIRQKVSFKRLLESTERRWKGGEFRWDSLVEAYIAFGLRRTEIDTQESLADEFSRLDIADALTTRKYDQYFYETLQLMVDYDVAISRFNDQVDEGQTVEGEPSLDDTPSKRTRTYIRGRNLFDTQAARVAFVVAIAVQILGRVGMDKTDQQSEERLNALKKACEIAVAKIDGMTPEEMRDFLALDVLTEKLSKRPTSAVGRWERAFFENSFRVLLEENFNVPSMEACWRG
ncbi:hypothetical protein ELH50_01210 [Rhizobium ruizarguesonis]|uniref:hypothetical protein n=1 Tax=Rhizobium TaxID=379 RepID=UPI001031ED3A|nr:MULTISPECIES: hypothetical protein [Rhizobium]TAU81957.1 hypothetical protein ELI40_00935 [Rhizobium leguminosarum]TBB09817.1 hypothetical protein ELH50_01210 [Rhizobium ruizarguesonis]